MGQSKVSEFQVFAGGLNLRPAEHLIGPTQSRYAQNMELRSLNIKPLRNNLYVEPALAQYVYYFAGVFHYFDVKRSSVENKDHWYFSDGFAVQKTTDGVNLLPVGIAPPISRLTAVLSAVVPSGEGITGAINYVYTYVDPVTRNESPPSPPSAYVDVDKQAIDVSGFVVSPDGYDIRLYRLGGNIVAYTAVIDKLNPDVALYADQLGYTEMRGTLLTTARSFPPQPNLNYLTEHQGRYYGSVGNYLYYSAPGNCDSWFDLDLIKFDHEIKSIASVSNGLLVMEGSQTFVITGSQPERFNRILISASEGSISHNSLAVATGNAIWLSHTGLVMSNGGSMNMLSINKLGIIRGIDPSSAAIYNQRYIMAFAGALYPSNTLYPSPNLFPGSVTAEGVGLPSGAILVDFTLGEPAFSTVAEEGLTDLGVYVDNTLYQTAKGTQPVFNIVTEDGLENIVTENADFQLTGEGPKNAALNKAFQGEDLLDITYVSPLFTDGSIGGLKQYEKVRITFRGSVTVTVLGDDNRVMQEEFIQTLKRDSIWIGIPVARNRAFGIKFKLVGKCEVDSIMYVSTQREAQ